MHRLILARRSSSLVSWLEARLGDLVDADGLVGLLVGGHDGRVGHEGEVDARVRNKVVLELAQVHVEGALKYQCFNET